MDNDVKLIARLGKDPELKTTPNGNQVCALWVATNKKYKLKDGTKKEETHWHSVECWGKLANIAHEYGNKGDLALVRGELKYDERELDGKKIRYAKIVADKVLYLNTKDKPTKGEQERMQQNSNVLANAQRPVTDASFTADDIPF